MEKNPAIFYVNFRIRYQGIVSEKLILHLSLGFLLYIPYYKTNRFVRCLQIGCKVDCLIKYLEWLSLCKQIG